MSTVTTPGLDFLTIARIALRRWAVVIPVLILTGVSIFVIADRVEPEYGATGSVLVQRVVEQDESSLMQPLTVNNFVVAEVLESDEVMEELQSQGLPVQYDVTAEENGGIMSIEAVGQAPDGLVGTVAALLARAEAELTQRQEVAGDSANPDAFRVLSTPSVAVAESFTIATPESPALVRYVARGSAVIATLSVGTNPYRADSYTTRVLTEATRGSAFLEPLMGANSTTTFELGADPRDPAPIIAIEVTGSRPADVTDLYGSVEDSLGQRLLALQDEAGVAPSSRLELRTLATPFGAELLSTNLARPVVAIGGLGFLAAITLALALDPWLLRRKQRRVDAKARTVQEPSGVPTPPQVRDQEADDQETVGSQQRPGRVAVADSKRRVKAKTA